MLGFAPEASVPVASIEEDNALVLGSQTLTLTLSSVALSAAVNKTLDSQSLITTQNSLTLQAAANFALNSQNLSVSLNSVTAQTTGDATVNLAGFAMVATVSGAGSLGGDNCAVAALPVCAIPYPDPAIEYTTVYIGTTAPAGSQTLTTTLNSVAVYEGDFILVGSQPLTFTQNSLVPGVGPIIELGSQTLALTQNNLGINVSVTLTSQSLSLTQNSLTFITNADISLTGVTLTSTLNGFRLWKEIDTLQPSSCNGWIPGDWNLIQFGDLIYGDNFAIASTPIAVIPPELEPIRRDPPQQWADISTTTTTTWSDIPT